jgi:hypothetical protein
MSRYNNPTGHENAGRARQSKRLSAAGLTAALAAFLLVGCAPQAQEQEASQARVATSFWKIGSEYDADRPGYRILYEGKKMRHCYPVTAWFGGYGEDDYHALHHHGVAVESELMAYRLYFDKKQTVDVYCKRTPRLELAESCWYPNDQLLAEHYGDDILRVGGTIGVGSVNYWRDGKIRHFKEVGERQQWIVEQNDSMAVIEVSDIDWTVPDEHMDDVDKRLMVNFSAKYTMCAGHRDMRCDVRVSKPIHGLCTGVQAIPNKGFKEDSEWISERLPNGVLLASWGTDWPVNDTAKYAKETVGLGVFIPKKYAGKQVQNDYNNLCLLRCLLQRTDSAHPERAGAHFYLTCVGATKEDQPVATTAAEWFDYLRQWAETLD